MSILLDLKLCPLIDHELQLYRQDDKLRRLVRVEVIVADHDQHGPAIRQRRVKGPLLQVVRIEDRAFPDSFPSILNALWSQSVKPELGVLDVQDFDLRVTGRGHVLSHDAGSHRPHGVNVDSPANIDLLFSH